MGLCLSLGGPSGDALAVAPAYKLIKKLGEGAEGFVWLAEEKASGELFALKFVSIKSARHLFTLFGQSWEATILDCRRRHDIIQSQQNNQRGAGAG